MMPRIKATAESTKNSKKEENKKRQTKTRLLQRGRVALIFVFKENVMNAMEVLLVVLGVGAYAASFIIPEKGGKKD